MAIINQFEILEILDVIIHSSNTQEGVLKLFDEMSILIVLSTFDWQCLQFGKAYLRPCVEAGLRAIRKERFRMFCAEHYQVDHIEMMSAATSIITLLDCLARLFDDHLQLKLVRFS